MSVVERMTQEPWEHSDSELSIEGIVMDNPEAAENLSRMSLRFIAAKGLSDEFEAAVREILGNAEGFALQP